MATQSIASDMNNALRIENTITPDMIQTFTGTDKIIYAVDFGSEDPTGEYTEAYVYIVYKDGTTETQRVYSKQELELWTTHLI